MSNQKAHFQFIITVSAEQSSPNQPMSAQCLMELSSKHTSRLQLALTCYDLCKYIFSGPILARISRIAYPAGVLSIYVIILIIVTLLHSATTLAPLLIYRRISWRWINQIHSNRNTFSFLSRLILYCSDDALKKEVKFTRFVATQYYLSLVFHAHFNGNQQTSDKNKRLFGELYGAIKMSDSSLDIRHKSNAIFNSTKQYLGTKGNILWIIYYAYCVALIILFVQCVIVVNYLIETWNIANTVGIVCLFGVYMVLEIISFKMQATHQRFCVFRYSFLRDLSKVAVKDLVCSYEAASGSLWDASFAWNQAFESSEEMLIELDAVHYLIFDQFQEIKVMYDVLENIIGDTLGIVAEYMYIPLEALPTIDTIDHYQASVRLCQLHNDKIDNILNTCILENPSKCDKNSSKCDCNKLHANK